MSPHELPYDGTSGWSGSDASKERADALDASGKTNERQNQTLAMVDEAEAFGVTWNELGAYTGWHHGVSSSVLSVLHKTGHLVRLTERRNRCSVYVTPRWVGDREVAAFRPNKRALTDRERALLGILDRITATGTPEQVVNIRLSVLAEVAATIKRLSE